MFRRVTSAARNLLFLLGLLLASTSSLAAEPICAEVVIEIKQELTLERQAFEATLKVNNPLSSPLENVGVAVHFLDSEGNEAVATSDTSDLDAKFFIRVSSIDGADSVDGTGTIASDSAATIRWLIVPAAGAAGEDAAGELYYVGATLTYVSNNAEEEIEVAPDTIIVKPQPKLVLDYFLTEEIIGDDAFTQEVEPPVPYTLGLRISNTGAGVARSVQMDSSQPEIVENDQGLAVDFRITGSSVNDEEVTPSLLLNFGDIESQSATVGRWIMETTLSGRFKDFTARFTHADEYGGQLTSLIDSANTSLLVHNVKVDLLNRDNVRDFLTYDGVSYTVYESESTGEDTLVCSSCAEVTDISGGAQLGGASASSSLESREISHTAASGFTYLKIPDPYAGEKAIYRVVRGDGKLLLSQNAWISQERAENKIDFNYFINIFDVDPSGSYNLTFGEPVVLPAAPVVIPVLSRTIVEGEQVGFLVRSSDPNGTLPVLSLEQAPYGAEFEDNGNGEGTFTWQSEVGQSGEYQIKFAATDGALTGYMSTTITVTSAGDTDGDGMDDDWEIENFGDLSQTADGDFDRDGIPNSEDDEPAGSDLSLAQIQVGTVEAGFTDLTTSFVSAYNRAPLVFVGVGTDRNAGATFPQLNDINSQGFYLSLLGETPQTAIVTEEHSYLSMLPGRYFTQGAFSWEAGAIEMTTSSASVDFTTPFAGTPKVFLTLQSGGDQRLFVETNLVSDEGVSFQLNTVEGGSLDVLNPVVLGYLAIYESYRDGETAVNGIETGFGLHDILVSDEWNAELTSPLRLKEDTTSDDEVLHAYETVDVLEIGTATLTQIASGNESDPVVVVADEDTDSDGIYNHLDSDDDNDGVDDVDDAFPLDASESTDTDGDGVGDFSDAFPDNASEWSDQDSDGMGDNFEALYGLDPLVDDSALDADSDGVSNLDEFRFGINPTDPDSDSDGIPDGDETDHDDDGMDDLWELEFFGNLNRDGSGDFDDDGYSDLTEFQNGSSPVQKAQPPTIPVIVSPVYGADVQTLAPTLVVRNGEHDAGMTVVYRFEVYSDGTYSQKIAEMVDVAEGFENTEAVFTEAALIGDTAIEDNTVYFWRARAEADEGISEWVVGKFRINTVNDSPSGMVADSPAGGAVVSVFRPTLSVSNASDPDDTLLTYTFEVYSGGQVVASISQLQQGAGGTTEWTVPDALVENGEYEWRARVVDPSGASQETALSSFLVSTINEAPTAPVIIGPMNGAEATSQAHTLNWSNSSDPEGSVVQYQVQVDTVATFDSAQLEDYSGIVQGQDTSSWANQTMLDNQSVFWRVRATDGELFSAWSQASFFVNTENDAPSVPVIDNPGDDATVELTLPTLRVFPSTDVDGDQLSYRFELYEDVTLQNLVYTDLTQELFTATNVVLADNRFYFWRAQAQDDEGAVSAWTDTYRFFVNDGGVDDLPELQFIEPAGRVVAEGGSLDIKWTDFDPDSAAQISLYYSRDGGLYELIIAGLPEDLDGNADSYQWNLAGLEQGVYRLKAVIEDASSRVEVESDAEVVLLPDPGGVTLTKTSGDKTNESGTDVVTYSVTLDRAPLTGSTVTLNLALSAPDEARILVDGMPTTYVQFNSGNWDVAREIQVQGRDDCEVDGEQAYSMVLSPLVSDDPGYAGLDPADVALANADNEVAGQALFICEYKLVSEVQLADGQVAATYSAVMYNTGGLAVNPSAKIELLSDDMTLLNAPEDIYFPDIEQGVKRDSYETFTVKYPPGEFKPSILAWDINPGIGIGVNGLPEGWSSADIAYPGVSGTAEYSDSQFAIRGGGSSFFYSYDSYHYAYVPLIGDGSFITQITLGSGTSIDTRAGIVIRESLSASSKNFAVFVSGDGQVGYNYRRYTGLWRSSDFTSSGLPEGAWLKIERDGNTISGFYSFDSENWNLVHSRAISMDEAVYVGIAVTSGDSNETSTASFGRIKRQ